MFHHFKLMPFIAGLVLSSIVFLYLKTDNKERVTKWPRPENAGKVVYRDRNGLCYTFEAQITDCAKAGDKLQTYSFE
jgi:hypothetical protein